MHILILALVFLLFFMGQAGVSAHAEHGAFACPLLSLEFNKQPQATESQCKNYG